MKGRCSLRQLSDQGLAQMERQSVIQAELSKV